MKENFNLNIATNLQYLRKSNNKTQKDIGDLCNKTDTAVSNWEKGIREPDATDLGIIAGYFGVTVDDILFRDLRFEYQDILKNASCDKKQALFDKAKKILSDDDWATIEFIMNKTIDNYEKNKKE